MKIRKINNQLLDQIESVTGENKEWDSNELTALCKATIKKEFDGVRAWDEYNPNKDKPYAIVNTDNTTGDHWVGAYFDGKTVFVYDSFARTMRNLMKDFIDRIKSMRLKIVFCIKGKDQAEKQINCGLRSFVWIYLTSQFGIRQTKNI